MVESLPRSGDKIKINLVDFWRRDNANAGHDSIFFGGKLPRPAADARKGDYRRLSTRQP